MTVATGDRGWGARRLIAVDDDVRLSEGRPFAPAGELWDAAVDYWRTLNSDAGVRSTDRSRSTPQRWNRR
jgi:3-isopropylmalate/(R)-2-methylmalate dehydratase large subunit